jgi:hypothetical protein
MLLRDLFARVTSRANQHLDAPMANTSTAGPSNPAGCAAHLLSAPVRVVNIGLESFAAELKAQGVPVAHVQWQPPAGGDERMAALLAKLGM